MTQIEGKLEPRRRRGEGATATEEVTPTTIAGTFRRVRRGRSVRMREAPPPPDPGAPDGPTPEPAPRPARVAVMLALAHKLQRMLDDGQVHSMAEIAEMLGVTRARVTQILDLALLPVAQQERVLFIHANDGRDPLTEREMRPLIRAAVGVRSRR